MSELIRYFSKDKFKNYLEDFDFLFKKIKGSLDELDIKLRNNYFNLIAKAIVG